MQNKRRFQHCILNHRNREYDCGQGEALQSIQVVQVPPKHSGDHGVRRRLRLTPRLAGSRRLVVETEVRQCQLDSGAIRLRPRDSCWRAPARSRPVLPAPRHALVSECHPKVVVCLWGDITRPEVGKRNSAVVTRPTTTTQFPRRARLA